MSDIDNIISDCSILSSEMKGGDGVAKRINNMNELQVTLLPVMKDMVNEMADRVYQTLNYFLLPQTI